MTGIPDPLFFIGVVEENDDPRVEGRVQVRAFSIHGTKEQVPTEFLPWAILAKGDYDPNGAFGSGIPEINNFVFGVMLDGRDAQQPLILGLIPTQFATPWNSPGGPGEDWGAVPRTNPSITARGTAPENFGQPLSDRLTRAENLEETYVLQQEMGRTLNIPSASGTNWEEPPSSYDATPGFNKVLKVGSTSIEVDGSPDSERIMIYQGEGSFIQISSNGVVTEKSANDKYEVIDGKQHVSAGRGSEITIVGNSYVKVVGNKVEEITGDLQQIVHGNHILSVGGQSTHQAGVQLQFRAADIKTEANVGTFSIKAAKEMQVDSGQGIYFKSDKVWMEAADTFNILGTEMFITGSNDFNIKGDTVLVLGSDGELSVRGTTVHIDDNVNMANGDALPAFPAEGSKGAAAVEAPEPPEQSTDIGGSSGEHDPSSRSTRGAASQDDGSTSSGGGEDTTGRGDGTGGDFNAADGGNPAFIGDGYPLDFPHSARVEVIRQEARLRNIEEEVAVGIYLSEGQGSYQSTVARTGSGSLNGYEASFGPYQLFIGGGMGNDYQQRTGRDLQTDNTREGITNQIRFALDQAVGLGWQPWYGRLKVPTKLANGQTGFTVIGVRQGFGTENGPARRENNWTGVA